MEMTHLDPREPQNASLLALQPLVHLVGGITVDLRLGHEGESHSMVEHAELCDPLVVSGLLSTELEVGNRKTHVECVQK